MHLTADSSDPAKYGPVIAFDSIQSYLEAAQRQQRRIERIKTSLHPTTRDSMRKGRIRHLAKLFAEVHFYLICWARIEKLARFIQHKTRYRRIGRCYNHIGLSWRIEGTRTTTLNTLRKGCPAGRSTANWQFATTSKT